MKNMISKEKTDTIAAINEYEFSEAFDMMKNLSDDNLKLINNFMKNMKTVTTLADLLSLSKEEAKKYYEEAGEAGDDVLAIIFHYKYILERKKEN